VPQLIILALFGAGAYAGYRLLHRAREAAAELRRRQEEMARASAPLPVERDLGSLEYDAQSGVYRPARRG
jgi:type II secretory pathway component PulJ